MPDTRQTHFRMFALYNRWANRRLYDAASALPAAELGTDRGAFFRSVLGTLNHLLVTDRLWLGRLEGESARDVRLDAILHEDLAALRTARAAEDQRLIGYVFGLAEEDLAGPLSYATTSGAVQTQPLWQVLAHLFNHQTHHRGQAHDLIGQILGRDRTPVLDLLAYQRSAAATDAP
jgi:uncharacterized damage-inducible protein DinB